MTTRDQVTTAVDQIVKSRESYASAYALGFVQGFLIDLIEELPDSQQEQVLQRFVRHARFASAEQK